jgi:hypothetical protein
VYGSGFGMPRDGGFFRIVFLAEPRELESIFRDVAAFTGEYLRQS